MLDRTKFIRPIAHRGLHDRNAGVIENTGPAFLAADRRRLRHRMRSPAGLGRHADGVPRPGAQAPDRCGRAHQRPHPADLAKLRYRGQDTPILPYTEFLAMVAGRVPLLVEIKSEWDEPLPGFLEAIAAITATYQGPLALMSFDPASWRAAGISRRRCRGGSSRATTRSTTGGRTRSMPPARSASPIFSKAATPRRISSPITSKALPTPVTRFTRDGMGLPLFTWTVRSERERAIAAKWADAPIFEGYRA